MVVPPGGHGTGGARDRVGSGRTGGVVVGALRVRGGAPPALPDDVWRVIVLERMDGIRARRLAGVSRMFNELAVEHEDNRVPDSTAATDRARWSEGA